MQEQRLAEILAPKGRISPARILSMEEFASRVKTKRRLTPLLFLREKKKKNSDPARRVLLGGEDPPFPGRSLCCSCATVIIRGSTTREIWEWQGNIVQFSLWKRAGS